MRRKLFGSATVVLLLVAAAHPAAAAIHRVRDTPVREYGFAIDRSGAGQTVRAWSADSVQLPYLFSVYWQAGGDPPTRRTGPATPAFVGGLDLDNSRGALLSYEAYSGQTDSWDARLYDLVASQAVGIPPGVNTRNNETHPTVSGDYLLFERGGSGPRRVILYNLLSQTPQVLWTAPPNGVAFADRVNGDYAVFTVCPYNGHCVVRRYQISTDDFEPLPDANRAAYSSTVTSGGDVYYVIGDPRRCGVNTQIHRWTGGRSAPRIEQIPNGIDVSSTWAYEKPAGGRSVYFTRYVCLRNGFRSGIYVTNGSS
jgi:hypothetical protein